MDKGFNDQELTDIMKEIEALEEEFSEDTEASVMEELAELEEEKAIPVSKTKETVLAFDKRPEAKAYKGTHSSMSFKVQGEMNLELQFEIGGKTISLDVSEAGLTINMEGGVTFTVPVADAHSVKKAV